MKITVMELDKPNKNGRIYPREMMEREIARHQDKFICGKLGMKSGDGVIDFDKVSHTVHNLRIEGPFVIGELEILDTPNGRILKDLNCMNGIDISNSFRCAGTGEIEYTHDGTGVVENYRLLSINYTDEPA